jgi:hypothetical protein
VQIHLQPSAPKALCFILFSPKNIVTKQLFVSHMCVSLCECMLKHTYEARIIHDVCKFHYKTIFKRIFFSQYQCKTISIAALFLPISLSIAYLFMVRAFMGKKNNIKKFIFAEYIRGWK